MPFICSPLIELLLFSRSSKACMSLTNLILGPSHSDWFAVVFVSQVLSRFVEMMLFVLPQADTLIIKILLISISFVCLTVILFIVPLQADHRIVTKQLIKGDCSV